SAFISPGKLETGLKPKKKSVSPRQGSRIRLSACTERVLEACLQLTSQASDLPLLREQIVNSAGKVFHAVTGMMLREGETLRTVATASPAEDGATNQALLSHSRSFAVQAIEQKRLVNFRLSSRSAEGATFYHGLAQPLITAQSMTVLLMVRSGPFT